MATSSTPKSKKAPHVGASAKEGFVTVKIGPQQQQYHVHKALITHHSEYFRNAFNGPWKESAENYVSLDDVGLETFEVFVQWLYTQKMPAIDKDEAHTSAGEKGPIRNYQGDPSDYSTCAFALAKAIVFGVRFLAPAFHRAANNALVDLAYGKGEFQYFDFHLAANYTFEKLPEEHTINNFFLDLYCVYLDTTEHCKDDVFGKLLDIPHRMLAKVTARYARRGQDTGIEGTPWREKLLDSCSHYYHGSNDQDVENVEKQKDGEKERKVKPEPEDDDDDDIEGWLNLK